ESHTLAPLQDGDDRKQILGLRVSRGAEHSHQALGRAAHRRSQLWKANCGIDEIAQNSLSCFHVAAKERFHGFPQERFAECSIALHALLDRLFEITSESHFSSYCFRCL